MKSKITSLNELVSIVEKHKRDGKTIVFTNGCFDILHAGHVRYLSKAKEEGDILIIGLNSDTSVKRIKGEKKPIVEEAQRAEVLSALYAVDYITIFDESDPLNLILALKPHVLVKGADWEEKDIIGAKEVKSEGGKVSRISLVGGISTTEIINRILRKYS